MNCGLNSEQIAKLYQLTFKRINDAKTSGHAFDMRKLMTDIYDKRLETGHDEVDAVTFAQQIPILTEKVATANPELKAHMRSHKFDFNQLADDVIAIDNAIKASQSVPFMKTYLGISDNAAEEIQDANKALSQDAEVENKEVKNIVKVPLPSSTDFAGAKPSLDEKFEAVTPSMLTDRDQEALSWLEALPGGAVNMNYNKPNPDTEFYYKVKRKILNHMFSTNQMDSGKISYPKVGPIHLKVQSSSIIAKEDLRPITRRDKYGNIQPEDAAWKQEMENAHKHGVVMMLTDDHGYPLRFDKDGEIDYGGKPAYYLVRQVKVSANGDIVMTERDRESAKALARQTGVTEDVAVATIRKQLEFIQKLREYIAKDPANNHALMNINGGSLGYTEFDYEKINTPIKSINFGNEVFHPYPAKVNDPVKGERVGTTYFKIKSMGDKAIEIERPTVSSIPGMMDKLISILTDKLVKTDPTGRTRESATAEDIQRYFDTYFYTKKETIRVYDNGDGTHTVRLMGEKLDLSTPETIAESKAKLDNFFSQLGPQREIAFKDMTASQKSKVISTSTPNYKSLYKLGFILKQDNPGGDAKYFVIEYPKVNVNDNLLAVGAYNDITLEPQKDGSVLVEETKKSYSDFIKDNFSIHYALNPENKLLRLNAYFTYAPLDSEIEKIYGEDKTVQEIKDKSPEGLDTLTGKGPADKDSGSIIDDIWNNPLLKNKNQKTTNKKATIEQIEAAKKWYDKHPLNKHFPFEVMFNAINTAQPNGVASWTIHGITLYKGSDFSDLYHEAWHGFTQTFLTKAQRASLYKEVRGMSGSFTDFNNTRVQFSKASDLQIEEYLAEDFRSYMLSGKFKTETPVKKSIFRKILDFLKTLFGDLTFQEVVTNDKAGKTIYDLYEKMRVGNLSEYNFSAENTSFNSLNKGIESTSDEEVQKFLSYENSAMLVDSMDSLISELIDLSNAGLNPQQKIELARLLDKKRRGQVLEDGEADQLKALESRQTYRYSSTLVKTNEGRKLCYKYIQRRLAELHNELQAQLEKEENSAVKELIEKKIKTLEWAVKNFGNTDDFSKNKKGKGLIGYHILKSKFFPTEDKEEMLEEMDEDEAFKKGREGYDKSGNEVALKDLASKEILYLLRSLHKKTKDDQPVINNLGVPELIPFDQVWNRLARLLQNTLKVEEMYEKIDADSKNYPAFKQLLRKLGPVGTPGTNEYNLWTNFWQSFNKTRVPLIQMTVEATTLDEKGEPLTTPSYYVTIGDASGGHHKIGQRWNSYFKTTRTSKYIKPDDKGYNYLDIPAVLRDFPEESLPGRELEFFNAIGILLDPIDEIKTELRKGVGGAKWIRLALNHINYRGDQVRGIEDIMKEYPDIKHGDKIIRGKKDENSRYKELRELQGKYSDEFSNFMVTNAEGNTQFEHTLNNSLTVMVNTINAVGSYQELIALPHMSYLDMNRNPFVKASTWLNSVFHLTDAQGNMLSGSDPKFGKKRRQGTSPDSPTVKMNISNLSGVALKENGNMSEGGIASASADEFTKLILDFHLTLEGQPELMRHADKGTSFSVWLSNIFTNGESRRLYVDTVSFIKRGEGVSPGQNQAFNIILPHIAAELERVNIMKGLAASGTQDFDFDYMKRGQEFVTFDRALSDETKAKLYALDTPLMQYLDSDTDHSNSLKAQIYDDILKYFDSQINESKQLMSKVQNFMADSVIFKVLGKANNIMKGANVNTDMVREAAIKSFVYNSWIHNLESLTVLYGDLAQYKVAKEEFHKRNAGIGSTGNIYRTDESAKNYINTVIGRPYTQSKGGKIIPYNGIFNTAVVADNSIQSKYLKEYTDAISKDIRDRMTKAGKTEKDIKDAIDAATGPYHKMDEGDAQGWISLDAYRILLTAEGKWLPDHEELYQDILKGLKPNPRQVEKFFPTQKVQYYGPLSTDGLPVMAFHKFSLFPLIPTVVAGTNLEKLHDKMMNEGIDYALFKSGSKVGTLTKDGNTDKLYANNEDRTISSVEFTPNRVFLEFLKDQLEIAPEYKGKVIFSTQMRKLIEDGLIEGGVATDFEPGKSLDARREAWGKLSEADKRKTSKRYSLLKKYEDNISELTKLKKEELLKEIGWTMNDKGKLEGKLDDLMKFIKSELTRQDLSDHEIDFISVNKLTGKIENDLSMSLSADKIERMLNAIVVKRLVRQKVNGEGLIQVSGAGFENLTAYTNPKEKDLAKWGTNDLPTYNKGKDGTNAMKVKVALQGQFVKLLDATHTDGNPIGTIERLNEVLKDEEWLNTNEHRRMVTMVGVRIPVQGLNSMEFMEVREFLPTEAGNIIVPPAEIVAKSGSDFDIDKLTVMMPTYQRRDGKLGMSRGYTVAEARKEYENYKKAKVEREIEKNENITSELDNEVEQILRESGKLKTFEEFFKLLNNDKAIQNDLIWNIKEILALPENFVKLIRPNGTDIVKPLADDLSDKVMEYNPKDRVFPSAKGNKEVSGTRVLEVQYNLYKHGSNNIGKQTLGLGAVDNTYNSLFNRIGAYMNPSAGITTEEYKRLSAKSPVTLSQSERKKLNNYRRQTLFLPHNTITVGGEKAISLSNLLDKDNENVISDVISQLINGWVDIAKDAWIFNIQGNKEIAPALLFMVQAGVPFKTAVYLVSQPLVREYVRQQKLAKSTFAGPLGKAPSNPMFFRIKALENVLSNPEYGFNLSKSQMGKALKGTAYNEAVRLSSEVLKDDKEFKQDKLYSYISSKNPQYDDYQRAAFLHFIEIENMAKAVRDVKMRMNFDTTKSSTLFEAQNKMLMVEQLREDNRMPVSIIDDLLSGSPISSFYVQPFQMEIWKDLFTLRNHPVMNSFLINKFKEGIISDVDSTFGDSEKFANEFRNDFMSYVFQNQINNFDINTIKTYEGLGLDDHERPVKAVKSLTLGAFVHDGVMYVDKARLADDFNNQRYSEQVYADKGLAIIPRTAFPTANEYYRFVFEREHLRYINDFDKSQENKEFLNYSKVFADSVPQKKDEDKAEYEKRRTAILYEMWLRDMALDNVNNGWKLFESKDTYADQFFRIYDEFPELREKYSLMKSLTLSSTGKPGKPGYTNLKLTDTMLDADKLNVFHENLLELANSTIEKVPDFEDNLRISEFFSRFSTVAFLQSGLNTKSTFSMVRMVPQDQFLRLMKRPVEEYTRDLNNTILQDYYDKFVRENSIANRSKRIRYKNYVSLMTLKKSMNEEPQPEVSTSRITEQDGVMLFNHDKLGESGAKKLMEENPDSYFVFNGATQAHGNATVQDFVFYKVPLGNKFAFPTRKQYTGGSVNEHYKDVQGTIDPAFKEYIDRAIEALLEVKKQGKELVFNKDGYGQYLIALDKKGQPFAPQSFLYLSQQLFNNFGYVNPNYLRTATGRRIVQSAQPISDEMVRDFMKHCFR